MSTILRGNIVTHSGLVRSVAGVSCVEAGGSMRDDAPRAGNPAGWASSDEAFIRTGIWSGLPRAEKGYIASELGGNHVHRGVPSYEVSGIRDDSPPCTKHGTQSSSHTPGIMVHW